jgi:tRNA (guanosine-2'-O-)-methyltransferase
VDAKLVIDALGPHLGDERREKIDRVAATRLGGLVVVLENLHDPHNGGAALRSCEAIGVRELRVVGASFQFSERVTQGCDKWLDIVRDENIERAATALEALDARVPAAFLIGNERDGLTAAARAARSCRTIELAPSAAMMRS